MADPERKRQMVRYDMLAPGRGVSARTADHCNASLGQGSITLKHRSILGRFELGGTRDLDAWRKFGGFSPDKEAVPSRAAADSRGVLTLDMVDGREGARARWWPRTIEILI